MCFVLKFALPPFSPPLPSRVQISIQNSLWTFHTRISCTVVHRETRTSAVYLKQWIHRGTAGWRQEEPPLSQFNGLFIAQGKLPRLKGRVWMRSDLESLHFNSHFQLQTSKRGNNWKSAGWGQDAGPHIRDIKWKWELIFQNLVRGLSSFRPLAATNETRGARSTNCSLASSGERGREVKVFSPD